MNVVECSWVGGEMLLQILPPSTISIRYDDVLHQSLCDSVLQQAMTHGVAPPRLGTGRSTRRFGEEEGRRVRKILQGNGDIATTAAYHKRFVTFIGSPCVKFG